MEKMLALLLPVFTIGFLVGENLREHLYYVQVASNELVVKKDYIFGSPDRKKETKNYPEYILILS